jgi:hypothetical protein
MQTENNKRDRTSFSTGQFEVPSDNRMTRNPNENVVPPRQQSWSSWVRRQFAFLEAFILWPVNVIMQ